MYFGRVPQRYGIVRGCWRHFLPRSNGSSFFAERMTVVAARRRIPETGRRSFTRILKVLTAPHPKAFRSPGIDDAEGAANRSGAVSPLGSALLVPLGRAASHVRHARVGSELGSKADSPSGVAQGRPRTAAWRSSLRVARRRRGAARPLPRGWEVSRSTRGSAVSSGAAERDGGSFAPPGRCPSSPVPAAGRRRGRAVRRGGIRPRGHRRDRSRRRACRGARVAPRGARTGAASSPYGCRQEAA